MKNQLPIKKHPLTFDEFLEMYDPVVHTDAHGRIGFPEIFEYHVQIADDKTVIVWCYPTGEDFPDLEALVPPDVRNARDAQMLAAWNKDLEAGLIKPPGKPYTRVILDMEKYTMLKQYGFWYSKKHTGIVYECIDNRAVPGS